VEEVAKANIEDNVYFINMQKILTYPDDYGCDGHPNVAGHAKMAKVIHFGYFDDFRLHIP